jgi:hypothetical protein
MLLADKKTIREVILFRICGLSLKSKRFSHKSKGLPIVGDFFIKFCALFLVFFPDFT